MCIYIYIGLSRVNQLGWLMEGRVAREKGRWGARKSIDTDGNVASFRSPRYRSPGLQREVYSMGWALDSFRGESLSFRIRLSVMAIANFRIFSDSPPISDRSFSLLSFIDRASDKNLIPIQFGPRWCRFRRIKVWFMVVIIKRKAEGESVGLFAFRRLEACGVETARAFRTTEFHHALGVVSFRQISLLARRR